MPVLGVTGGIATGKSTFSREILRLFEGRRIPLHFFCADRCVSELLEHSAEVHSALREEFGGGIFFPDGKVNRGELRERVFGEAGRFSRAKLEAILHPRVREEWSRLASEVRESGGWLLVDIPLLYETGGEKECDAVVVIACSRTSQIERVRQNRGLSRDMAEAIVAAQAPLSEKIIRGNYSVWSDCSLAVFRAQVALLLESLLMKWGANGRKEA